MVRICNICGKEKPLEEFYFRKDSKTYRLDCKACFYETQSRWRVRNLDKVRIRNKRWRDNNLEKSRKHGRESGYKNKYGITLEDKRQMYRNQGGKCAICETKMTTTHNCMLDHNHTTGVVRALLCVRCNSGLSFLENREYTAKAKQYLKKYGELMD
jgi:hypothetical protein